jgi:hypothetical protein
VLSDQSLGIMAKEEVEATAHSVSKDGASQEKPAPDGSVPAPAPGSGEPPPVNSAAVMAAAAAAAPKTPGMSNFFVSYFVLFALLVLISNSAYSEWATPWTLQ